MARTLRLLAACRTEAFGGHISRCRDCGELEYRYHSCGDRHCPQCGGNKRAAWLAKRSAELLPVPYFHVVFTLPHVLGSLVLGNRRRLYELLFSASAQTLLEVAADPKHLGARIGVLSVLHTWGQQLEHHPHIHCVVPGGGLSPDGTQWRSCRPDFFLPVKVLGRVFRGKFLAGLREAYDRGELSFAGSTQPLADSAAFKIFLSSLYGVDWVVYAKKPFGGPEQVLKYLTRYTHRVALTNRRLVRLIDDRVTFGWKDYSSNGQRREMTLDAVEFIRRFTLHILPPRLVRIRHYGLLAHRDLGVRLEQCRSLLHASNATSNEPIEPIREPLDAPEAPSRVMSNRSYLLAIMLLVLMASGTPPAILATMMSSLLSTMADDSVVRKCPQCGGPLEVV